MSRAPAARMRVVIDARAALDPRRTGVGRYSAQIVRHLPPADPEARYIAWHLDAKGMRRGAFDGVEGDLTEAAGWFPNRWFEPVSSRLGVPRIEGSAGPFDVLLAPNFLPPTTRCRTVVLVVHDLAFEVVPETAPHVDARWRGRFAAWLARAARVIVPSASTRDDLIRLHDVDPARVDVVHHGTARSFRRAPPPIVSEVRRRFGIGDGPYVLFVGGIEPRKNLEALVRAFGVLGVRDPDPSMVIAGGAVPWFPRAGERVDAAIASLRPAVRSRVIRTGYVSEDDRAVLLSGASALAYPSLYEGFGFPVLEAFAASVPVLTANVSALPEVAGDAAVLVDPHDDAAIAEGLAALLEDPELRRRLADAGLARVAGFTWEACAARTADVLHRARGSTPG